MKKTRKSVILAFIQLMVAIILVVGSAYAWFSNSGLARMSGVRMAVEDIDSHFEVISINGSTSALGETRNILAGDQLFVQVKTIKDNSEFWMELSTQLLSAAMYADALGHSEFLRGPYEKLSVLNKGLTEECLVYNEFDIDRQGFDNNQKLDFLKKFTSGNNIASAFTAEITAIIRNTGVEEVLEESIKLVRNNESDPFFYVENVDGAERLVFDEGDVFFLKLTYGLRLLDDGTEWLPTMSISDEYDLPEYRALNLNCFIGQTVVANLRGKTVG